MKAIAQDVYGSADVLQFRDVDRPAPGPDEVLVQVRAAGVDQAVWHLMAGRPLAVRLAVGLRRPRAAVLGMDLAGVVEAVGANVTRFKPGDEVFGSGTGSFAEYACAKQDKLALKPVNLTFEQAAAVPVSGATALQALRGHPRGRRVLIIGAGGGVGSFAVQLAKAFGSTVTGVCSTSKVDLVRQLGADEVVDYTREDFATAGPRYDLILDIAGNRKLSHLRRALRPDGTLVIVGGEGKGPLTGGLDRQLRGAFLALFSKQKIRGLLALVRLADLQALKELIEAGKVTPAIDRTYPLSEAADAIRRLHDGHVRGKVVVIP